MNELKNLFEKVEDGKKAALPEKKKLSPMVLTSEMKKAVEIVENTTFPLFITGKAGTGKTTLLKYMMAKVKNKNFAVAASTGVAAVNAGGVTLHSLIGIPLKVIAPDAAPDKVSDAKAEVINAMDVLVIDEASMVRPDILDYIDRKMRYVRQREDEPFGGVQVVMFGDLYQLPPVVRKDEMNILSQFYKGPYFFYAYVFREHGLHVVELTKVFRQKDERFVNLLNDIRQYHVTPQDFVTLGELKNTKVTDNFEGKCIHLCSLRRTADEFNTRMLKTPTYTFSAKYDSDFNPNAAPVPVNLQLRDGARVMTVVNDSNHAYYNGSLGVVEGMSGTEIIVRFDNGTVHNIGTYKWVGHEYVSEGGKLSMKDKGKFEQYPLILAWAVTIHKSQGLTFDNVAIHAKFVFEPGQIYVALSRCRTLEGIATDCYITRRHIIPNNDLIRFEKAYKGNGYVFDRRAYSLFRRGSGNEKTENNGKD